jgi:hypothetical protein
MTSDRDGKLQNIHTVMPREHLILKHYSIWKVSSKYSGPVDSCLMESVIKNYTQKQGHEFKKTELVKCVCGRNSNEKLTDIAPETHINMTDRRMDGWIRGEP